MKKDIFVSEEELSKQKKYIENIRLINEGKDKTACVVTYGCAQNETDSDKLYGMLELMGYSKTDDEKNADIVIFNTCSVRENAEVKVYGKVGALKARKKKNPDMVVGICGCLMQQSHASSKIKKQFKFVDLVFGTHALYKFPELLLNVINNHERVFDAETEDGIICEGVPIQRPHSYKATIPIAYGCNNFCTYCVVPHTRGRERSRKSEDIINEIKNLCKNGLTEVTLVGQNVNSYGNDNDDDLDFPDLLTKISEIPEIRRIRFMTSHPKDITDKLIDTIAGNEKICKFLHFPFQAGNSRVLKEMNRKYTREDYLGLVDKIKAKIPDIALSADVIVGFPGETTEEFYDTVSLIEKVRFDTLFTFIYSPRKDTKAALMPDPLSYEEKLKNFNVLLETQNRISKEINDTYLNKTFLILDEGASKTNPDMRSGRCETNKIINYKPVSDVCEGDYVYVKVTECMTWSLNGVEVSKEGAV